MAEKKSSAVRPFDPFRELELFRAFPGFLRRFDDAAAISSPSVDIVENDGHYVVTAELPGVKKDEVTVELEDGVLTIRGEKKSEREEKEEHRRYVERSYGSFSRSFNLPSNADPDRVDASIANGVLTIEVAKREESKPKTIAVK